MPTKRTKSTRAMVPSGVSEVLLHVWSDGLFPMPEGGEALWLAHRYFHDKLPGTRNACRDTILQAWIDAHPGTRPSHWWFSDAPEKARWRQGGTGDPIWEHLPAYQPTYHLSIPKVFVTASAEAYYNGRARDIHGKRIGTEYHEGHCKGKSIDPNDPPRYEAQAAYLDRHGLLTSAEKRRLRPKDFKPDLLLP